MRIIDSENLRKVETNKGQKGQRYSKSKEQLEATTQTSLVFSPQSASYVGFTVFYSRLALVGEKLALTEIDIWKIYQWKENGLIFSLLPDAEILAKGYNWSRPDQVPVSGVTTMVIT